jgi:antitoxin (DNA-binding transcriptional repressor) of toxin-antitoxin stability system
MDLPAMRAHHHHRKGIAVTADQIAKWKAAIAASHRQQRTGRGRRKQVLAPGPGMVRLQVTRGPVARNGHACTLGDVSELPLEDVPGVADAAHEAARGEVVYITEHGHRLAAIVPAEYAEDLADAAAVRAARASIEAGEPLVPWEQVKAEAGL